MEKVNSDLAIENENLFRSLACLPPAIIFVLLAVNSVMNSGIVLFLIIYILVASYFTLSTLGYAALYANERFAGQAEPVFKNINLSKAIATLPLTIIFIGTTIVSVSSSAHIIFQALSALIACYFLLSTLAYAAFYTNDYHVENAG